jgi:PAS domain S-box-containing protein
VGLIVVMDTQPIAHQDRLQTLLQVFAPRVAAELQRKQAEHEHRQTLHEIQNIMETVPDFMFTLDTQGNMVKWNRHVEAVTGYSPEELQRKSALAFVPAQEQEHTADAIQRAFTDGYAELTGHLLTKDQRTIPYHWTGAALKDPQGRIIGITGIGRDISEQKQAAEFLQRQRHHLLEAQALAHLGSWEWDIESGETDWSEEQFRIFGHEPGTIAVTYDTFLAALLPDDHDRVLAAVNDALLGKCPLDLECRIVRPNGDIRVIHMRADVQRDATAHPIVMAGTALDITERTQTEEALRASEERWHLAVQGSNDGIWDWNIQAGEIFFSARWKAMRGFADHEVSNHIDEWRSRIHPDDLDRVLQSIDHYLAKQASAFCEEYRVQRKDGSYMWILDRGVALWADDGTPVRMAGSETDITDRKRTETTLRHRLEFEQLITSLSTHFINLSSEDIDSGITHALRSLAEFSDVDRSYVFIFRDHGRTVDNTHEWCAGGITPQIDRLQALPVDAFSWIMARHQRGEITHLSRMNDLPPEAHAEREECERKEIQSLLTLPIIGARGVIGFLGFDMVREERHWEPEDIALLKFVGEIFANAIERKQAEAALRKNVDRFDLGVQGSRDGLWYAERVSNNLFAPHNPIYYSPRMKEIMGVEDGTMPDVLGTWLSLVHPDDLPTVLSSLTQHLEQRLPYDVEYRILQHGTGTLRWIGAKGQAVWNSSGQPLRMAGSFSDITERKQAEEALRESEERYRTLVELSPSGVFVFSEGQTVYVNSMAMTILGATEPNDLLARPPFEFIHPDYHEDVTKNLRRVLAGEATVHRAERVYLKMDGTPIHVQVEAIRITWNGKPAIQGFFSDITERKSAQEELRRSKTRLSYILESNPAVVYTRQVGNGWPFTFITPNIYELLGYTSIDILTDPDRLDQSIHPDDDRDMMTTGMPQLLRDGAQTFVYRLRRRDGRYCWIENRARLTDDGQGTLQIVGTMLDITQRKQAEEALTTSERQLRTVLDSLPIGVWFTDEKGHVLYGNPVGHHIWAEAARVGLPQPGGTGLWWETIAQPESPHRWAVGTVLARGQNLQNEILAIETRAGEHRTIRNSAVPVKSDTGEMLGAIVLNEDITDRVRAEKALHQEHALLMAVMDAATDVIFVKDLDGRYIHINRAGALALRMPVEEVIGWNDYAIWPSDLAASCQLADRRVLETGEPVTVEEVSVCDGMTTIYLTTKAPYRNSEGQIIGVIGVARDITEQKHAEEALRASEQLFAKAFRASPNPIGITEVATGRCIDTNQACLDLLGFSRKEIVGQTTLMLGIWPNPQDWDMLITRLQTAGPMRNEEMTFSTKSGDLRHVLVSSDLVEMNGKKCLITVGNDITERIRAEEALREQHALLSAIMNTTMDIIFVKDLQGHYLHMNPAGARVVGLSPQEIVGKDDNAIWPADLAACCNATDRQILATGSAQTMEESTLANGKRITYLTTKAPYRDAAGHMIGIIGVAHDISQIKQSEEDLRRSHAFIRQIIDTDPNFIFAKDREGRFTLVNKAVADVYGTTVDHLTGKTDADFNSNTRELEFFRKQDLEVLNSLREQFIAEEMITDAAGHTRWLQTVKRPIMDETGRATMVLGASTDITERKRMEEALRQRERDLRTALDERERISQDLHDGILQSLYAVGLGLEACKPLMTQQHYKKAAASMDRAIGHLNHVMSEVRNFIAGLESQILQGSTFPMALRTMVLTLTADHPIPCTLTIDESLANTFSTEQALHLLNVVREALSNSLRHAEATKTTVSLKSLSRSIRLTIADDGRGFNPASLRGTGHGLTNMEARVRKIGGRFAIRSVPQRGTRITIDLPKESRHAESENEHGSPAARR